MGGPFKMASGEESNVMLDLSRGLRTLAVQNALMKSLGAMSLPDFQRVGGPLSGSDLLAFAMMSAGRIKEGWFGVRASPKNRGYDRGFLTGFYRSGETVLLLEDISTSGGTLLLAYEAVLAEGLRPIGALAVVDRGGLPIFTAATGLPGQALLLLRGQDLQVSPETYPEQPWC